MSAFNHRVYALAGDSYQRQRGFHCGYCRGSDKPLAMYQVQYDYVTGQGGRITDSKRDVCFKHAQRFAEKYGIEMPVPIDDSDGGAP